MCHPKSRFNFCLFLLHLVFSHTHTHTHVFYPISGPDKIERERERAKDRERNMMVYEALNPLFLKVFTGICCTTYCTWLKTTSIEKKKTDRRVVKGKDNSSGSKGNKVERLSSSSRWFPHIDENPQQRACEVWFLRYGIFWICCFAIIVGFRLYVRFDRWHYILVCGGLASPLLLQPIVAPHITKESDRPLTERYAFKANLWIAIYSFIGNYWYTHYFYSVLKARYTMPSWDLNGVPIAMYFATHFYFCFYHAFSNAILRKVTTTYVDDRNRFLFKCALIALLSYATAYAETLTISGFPCYAFEDRSLVYSLGSAFYGIYFIVSFPMFFRIDRDRTFSWSDVIIESLATGMMILCLLDFVRVGLGKDLWFRLDRPCKLDASLTCAPFDGTFC